MSKVEISFHDFDESFMKIETTDFGIDQEISEYFSFLVPGHQYMRPFRQGIWDGRVRLFDIRGKKIAKGLLKIAVKFCKDRNYTFFIDPDLNPKTSIDLDDVKEYVSKLDIRSKNKPIEIRDYQMDAILQSMRYYRNLLISPTSCLDPEEEIEVELNDEMITFIKEHE